MQRRCNVRCPNCRVSVTRLSGATLTLQQHMKALNLPAFMGRLIPFVEIAMSNPDRGDDRNRALLARAA
jgi:hypothetical protein